MEGEHPLSHKKLYNQGKISKAQYEFLDDLKKKGNLNFYHFLEDKWKKNRKGEYGYPLRK